MNTNTNITSNFSTRDLCKNYNKKSVEVRANQRDKIKELFLKEYRLSKNVMLSCERCGISRGSFYEWVKNDPEFAQKIDDIKEGLLDGLENRVVQLANQDEKLDVALKATTAFLNAKAKSRGWGKELDSNVNINLVADLRSKVLGAGDDYIDIESELKKDEAEKPVSVSVLLNSNVSNDRVNIDDEMQDWLQDIK